jgi:hypothetical protein
MTCSVEHLIFQFPSGLTFLLARGFSFMPLGSEVHVESEDLRTQLDRGKSFTKKLESLGN